MRKCVSWQRGVSTRVEALETRALLAAVSPAPVQLELDPVTDSGLSQTDGLTNYNNGSTDRPLAVLVRGTPSQSQVTLYADGVEIGSRVAFSDGYARVIARGDRALADGVHVMTARQVVPGGTLSPESAPLLITIDTAPPAPPAAPDLSADSDTGQRGDNVTADVTPTFDVTPSEDGRVYFEFDCARSVSAPASAGGTMALAVDEHPAAFAIPPTFDTFGYANRTVVADVNNDGAADLISSTSNTRLTIVLGNGDGTFRPSPLLLYPARAYPTEPIFLFDVVAADFDEDGNIDIAPIGGGHTLFLGNGDGTFREQPITESFGSYAAEGGDFNRDGHADFVTGGGGVYLGRGDGTFSTSLDLYSGMTVFRWVVDDFNGDGISDVAGVGYANEGGAEGAFVHLGNGDGTFQRRVNTPAPAAPLARHMASGDFNGDGFPDLVLTSDNYADGALFLNEATVLLGNGDGTFDSAPMVPTGLYAGDVVTGDFNGDGRVDWATSASERKGLTLALGNGDGTFRPTFLPVGSGSYALATGDFDRDGKTDLAGAVSGEFRGRVLLARRGPLADGAHSIRARLEDLAGNLSEPGAERSVTIDSTAQLVAEIEPLEADPHLGPVNDIRITFSRPVTGLDLSDLTLTRSGGQENLISAAQTLSSSDAGRTWTLGNLRDPTTALGVYLLTLVAGPGTGVADDLGHTLTEPVSITWRGASARVVGRHLFYNESAFDGFRATATAADLAAIAPDKRPLRAGERPTIANVSSYLKGINGVVIEFDGTPGAMTAADFQFDVGGGAGDTGESGGWRPAPSPQAIVRLPTTPGDPAVRYLITWPNGAVRNTWLRVTIKPNDRTGLAEPDTFAFGNLVGDTGRRFGRVDALDLAEIRRGMTSVPASIDSPLDINRDGRVSALDVAAARRNLGQTIPLAPVLTTPATAMPPPPLPQLPLRRDEIGAILA